MIKVKITENYGGFEICGDWEDLNFLYDSINYLIKYDEASIQENMMQDHLYGFLYDVRHAYQCSREFKIIENGLSNEDREYFGIKKSCVTNNNLYYNFNYMLPDLVEDIILIKYFIKKISKKENNIYNTFINNINLFYGQVIESFKELVTPIQYNKIKNNILNSYIEKKLFIPQWFEIISIDYANMNKNGRKKELIHMLDKIYNYIDYEDYHKMKQELEKECEKNNETLDDIHYEGYPDEIVW